MNQLISESSASSKGFDHNAKGETDFDIGGPSNKSLDASGGGVFCNWLGAAKGASIRAAASTQPFGSFAMQEVVSCGGNQRSDIK